MKRSQSENTFEHEEENKSKILLVEREFQPGGVNIVNPIRVAKKTYVEEMELAENINNADTFLQANATNRLEIIGRQMRNLHELMSDVINESKINKELHHVACNFVKKPGHTYHLYERISGQKYFSMLSPEEWGSSPHKYLGSYRLEADNSWTQSGQENIKYQGIEYLKNIYSNSGMKAIIGTNS